MNKSIESSIRDKDAIRHLRESILQKKSWYIALLEAVNLWNSTEEYFNDRHYQYLIDREAFDWLLLAERLCVEIGDLVPEEEILNLLFYDNPPVSLAEGEFKKKIGKEKYQAYLNFLYGVLVEEMLILSKMEEIRKRRRSLGLLKDSTVQDEAYRNLYNGTKIELMKRFQKEKGYPQQITVSIDKLREFTYWLFKLRIRISDKSRVASDTKQALLLLNRFMSMKNHTSIRSI